MASKYSIQAVFKLIDNVSAPLDRIAGKGNKVGRALKNDFISAQKTVDNAGASLKKFAGYAVAAGAALVGIGIGVATKQFIDFDNAITAASAKFKDVDLTTPQGLEDYQRVLKDAGKVAREVAAITEFDAVDTAGALDKMAMAGLSSSQSMKLLQGTTNLATASGMDLTTAVDIATDAIGAFGLISKDINEDQLAANLDRVSDVMARTTNMFNTDMAMMFEAIQKGAPAFTAAGQNIEEFSAMIGVLASSGVKGSEAGTQLRNMILSLSAPVDAAQMAMDRLGISVSDANGNFINVLDIIGQFENAFGEDVAKEFKKQVSALENIEGVAMEDQIEALYEKFSAGMVGNTEKIADLNTIFGKRTVTSMLLLLAEGSAGLKQYTEQLQNAGGTSQKIADAMRGSIKNKIEQLKGALTELGFKFIEAFQEKGSDIIVKLADAITKFDPAPMISALTTTATVIMFVSKVIWKLRYFIIGIAIAWGIYKAAMLAAVIIGPIIGMIKAVQALMAAQQGMNAVQAIANVLMTANPIGIIITAIGLLIGLIIALALNWDKVCAAMVRFGGWIKNIASMIWGGLCNAFWSLMEIINENQNKVLAFIAVFTGPFGFILSIVNELRNNWGLVVETFKTDGIIKGLLRLGGVILSAMIAPIQGFLELLSRIPGVGKLLGPAVNKLDTLRANLKGTEENVERPIATRPPARERAATNPAAAANTAAPVANTTTPPPAARPAVPPAAPPALSRPSPSPVPASVTENSTGSPAVHQATLLDLRSPIPGSLVSPAPATSAIAAPVITGAGTSGNAVSSGPAASVTRSAAPVKVPVEYVFPELIIPPEIIKSVVLPVELDFGGYLPPMPPQTTIAAPGATQTITSGISPAGAVTRAAMPPQTPPVDFAPAISPLKLPLSPAAPVSGSIAESITPPVLPMTQAEQIIYSRSEHYENINIAVSPEAGTSARIVNPPKSPNVKLTISGDA